jgi:predicted amidohydrolase YtcJ
MRPTSPGPAPSIRRSANAVFAATLAALPALPLPAAAQQADMIVAADRIWTGNPNQPFAEAVAIRGDRILAVGTRSQVMAMRGANTRVIDMSGRFVTPGFIDNHTHFQSAGNLLLNVNLLDVADEAGLVRTVRAARDRLPRGAWLLDGQWGAYEQWALNATGREQDQPAATSFAPHRAMIDSITPDTPVLINKWDRSAYMANGRALELAGADCSWPGVECENNRMTGRLNPEAAARIRRTVPPKSLEQRLTESRGALRHLAELGVTTIHDNTSPDQMEVYQLLLANNELTTRIYARPTLDRYDELRAAGIRHGFGSEYLKIGGLKGFVDGIMGASSARFYEPYVTTGVRGSWRTMMTEPPGMLPLILGADSAGHWPQIHAIGDEAIDTLLDMYEYVIRTNGPKERRFRVIHTQVMRGPDVAQRMARLGIIAEVQPYHAIDDMRWMEERIGSGRSRWAYAFRTLHDAGVTLSFGSDWPGTNAAWYTASPLQGMYAATTRQTLDGNPTEGWFPEERIDIETALRAYTVNNAWVAGEEKIKGSLEPGKLADLVVVEEDLFRIPATRLKDIRVIMTIVGGRVVYEAARTDQ